AARAGRRRSRPRAGPPARGCWATGSIAEPANATATAIAATPRDRLLLVVMLAPSLASPFEARPLMRLGGISHSIVGRNGDAVHRLRRKSRMPQERRVEAFGVVLAHERAAAVFVDMDAHDLVKRALGFEAELARAARLDALRPACDDARDQWVFRAANARGNLIAGDTAQRRDLLGDCAAHSRHRKIDARSERIARQRRRVNEEADCGARAGMGRR